MKILFVCEGNVNRSQMAATIYVHRIPRVEVSSAGTMVPVEREGQTIATVSRQAIEAMKEIGYDMSANVMHQLTPEMVEAAGKIILVGPTPGGPLPDFLAHSEKLEKWDVPDPGYGHIGHREARDMIMERIERLTRSIDTGHL